MRWSFFWLAFGVCALAYCAYATIDGAWHHNQAELWVSAGCVLVNANTVRLILKHGDW